MFIRYNGGATHMGGGALILKNYFIVFILFIFKKM